MEYESEQQQQQRMAGSHYGPYAGRGKQPLDTASNDEIAQRFAHFFFRVLATEPEKVTLCVFMVECLFECKLPASTRGSCKG